MTATTREDKLLQILDQGYRPDGPTLTAELTPRDYDRLRKLAIEWDTHPIHALGRALQLAEELQGASARGAEIHVRWPLRLRRRHGYKIKTTWKGPKNP